ncbi:MAG TPA: phosphatidylglycerol lysyltransferase domain-containing protein, partial [Bacillota bacterium]|nr:phosphatidylglycerol lysyltransferase domain-containing protein [Bacillota bacterium]
MDFREITLDDKHIFGKFGYICSDYQFSYLYMYNNLYKLKIAESNGAVIIRSDMDSACFYMPLGDTAQGIEAVLKYCSKMGTSPVFSKIPQEHTGVFKDFGFVLEEDRDSFDYIFRKSDFIGYEGKNFRNQRNNYSSYLRALLPEFDERIELYIDKCKAFTLKYHNTEDKLEPTYKMLDSIAQFNLKGGV